MNYGGQAFETRTGVDGRLGQRGDSAGSVAIELHENQVPDFDVAAAIAGKLAVGVSFVRCDGSHVVMNFAARAAGAGVAHGPEIFFQARDGNDALGGNVLAQPQFLRFFVNAQLVAGRYFRAAENRDVQFFFIDSKPVRRSNQFPGVGDGVFLEIIAERKIAHHFKKSVVALGEADVFEVVVLAAGAHAFLRRGGAFVIALFQAEKNVLELIHTGIGKEQRGIAVGHERAAAHDAMTVAFEEF